MKCQKCGEINSDSSKFCKKCGETLENNSVKHQTVTDNHKKIIFVLIAIIAILLIAVGVYASGILTPVTYETQSFDGFEMDVPSGSKYVLSESLTNNKKNIFVGYLNKGEYDFEATAFQVGNNLTEKTVSSLATFEKNEGDVKIYKNESDGTTFYEVFRQTDDANILIYGNNIDMMIHMAKSFKTKDFKKLASKQTQSSTASSQSTSSSAPSTSTPSSISILGGSFSTGSADEDKTYARINVGTSHAGEDVIVQIWYSRDGNTLNNGNMVPASVHSDGYLEISSADAYKYYPDHATINIYDTNSKLLATQSVSLSPSAGTQTF